MPGAGLAEVITIRLTTRTRYGLRSLVDLAEHMAQGPVSLTQIARRQELTVKFLEQQFLLLRQSGIVRSVQGSRGGYTLCSDPSAIQVVSVIRILEGDAEIVDLKQDPERLTPYRTCLDRDLWDPLNKLIDSFFSDMTLADLMQDPHRELHHA